MTNQRPRHGGQVLQPGRGTRWLNRIVLALSRRGVSLFGSRELIVRGRVSGATRRTPVNPVTVDGVRYLISPRGHTQWTRNVAADNHIELRNGKHGQGFLAVRIDGDPAVRALRAYLSRWFWEVKAFFPEGVTAKSTDAELAAVLGAHPVFRLDPA